MPLDKTVFENENPIPREIKCFITVVTVSGFHSKEEAISFSGDCNSHLLQRETQHSSFQVSSLHAQLEPRALSGSVHKIQDMWETDGKISPRSIS